MYTIHRSTILVLFILMTSFFAHAQKIDTTVNVIYHSSDSTVLSFTNPLTSTTDTMSFVGGQQYTVSQDSLFQHLDKTRIPFGILYNRVWPFELLNLPHTNDTVTVKDFTQALSEMQRSDYNFNDSGTIIRADNLKNLIRTKNDQNIIPILSLSQYFSTIDSNAGVNGGIISTNGLLYDGDLSANPYTIDSVQTAVLGINKRIDSGKIYNIIIRQYGNSSNTISSVSITNLTTSESWTVSPGSVQALTFGKAGDNYLTLDITFIDGNLLHRLQKISVVNLTVDDFSPCSGPITPIDATIPFTPYGGNEYNVNTGSWYNGTAYGHGEYQIFYNVANGCTNKLNKPIIMTDGFDPQDGRDINGIYRLLRYQNAGSNVFSNLGNDLRNLGYDVIILNFPQYIVDYSNPAIYLDGDGNLDTVYKYRDGGTDFIERNANITIELINKINTQLKSDHNENKLVVVGPSMGGLATRYALRYMENNGMDHNTRLWVSFDAPHLGANIPFGIQDFVRYSAWDLNGDGTAYYGTFLSPAARQLLLSDTWPGGFYTNYAGGLQSITGRDPVHVQWLQTLASLSTHGYTDHGYPENCRRIAIANGANNHGVYHNPGDLMMSFHMGGYAFLPVGFDGNIKFIESGNASHFDPNFRLTEGILHTYNLSFWGIQWIDKRYNLNIKYNAIDGNDGGMHDFQQDVATSAGHTFINIYGAQINMQIPNLTHNACFIPTCSALAILGDSPGDLDYFYSINHCCPTKFYVVVLI
jgi:hypothetical protein